MLRRTCFGRFSVTTQRVAGRTAFTLVEMLIAMAITLVMMASVATLFANVSNSVRNRRATIELGNQLRQVRNVLQQDLQGATCPGVTWQRSESNHGYIEIIEGRYRDSFPSELTDGEVLEDPDPPNAEITPADSLLPRMNPVDANNDGQIDGNEWEASYSSKDSLALGSGLGDYDDILMLTVRNEHKPFIGRMPTNVRQQNGNNAIAFDVDDTTDAWGSQSIESTLAEVIWFAIENPDEETNATINRYFGEPGMRTIYRRTLLIAPWVNPYRVIRNDGTVVDIFQSDGDTFKAEPGLVRLLPDSVNFNDVVLAIASIIAFQERYDLSVRLEWDPNIGKDGRWKLIANTLGDLTKRENRFGHFGLQYRKSGSNPSTRNFPFAAVSTGRGYNGNKSDVLFVMDPEVAQATNPTPKAAATAHMFDAGTPLGRIVQTYTIDPTVNVDNPSNRYPVRPLAIVDDDSAMSATAWAMLNEEGQVIRVIHSPVPLWDPRRRGEDVMMTDVLAFDLRVFDPGAPLFGVRETPGNVNSPIATIIEPSDKGWFTALLHSDNMRPDEAGAVGTAGTTFPFVRQGAYVDLGYGFYPFPEGLSVTSPPLTPHLPQFRFDKSKFPSAMDPWFYVNRGLTDVMGNLLAPGYSVYDTWSWHYENDGVNQDNDGVFNGVWQSPPSAGAIPSIDEGTNGLEDFGHYSDGVAIRLGPDDVGERETAPPYDKPLRGAQVMVRAYERDSRAIRQVRVSQHFMQE